MKNSIINSNYFISSKDSDEIRTMHTNVIIQKLCQAVKQMKSLNSFSNLFLKKYQEGLTKGSEFVSDSFKL